MWVRSYGAASELVVVSDSRLSGGKTWDQSPKVFPLSRGDCMMSFSGETDYAYPLLLHAMNTIDAWEESRNRRYNLESLRGHLSRVLTSALAGIDYEGISPLDVGDQTILLLGGYSWWSRRWIIWSLRWDGRRRSFSHATLRTRASDQRGSIRWTGDSEAVGDAKKRLNLLLRQRGRTLREHGLNMEPVEIVRDIVREGRYRSIGGPLQIAKVYKHLNSRMFLVPWHDGTEIAMTLGGRFLLPTEKSYGLASIDPERPDVFTADEAVMP